MVDPIGSFSATPWNPALDDDEDARRRAATATSARPSPVPDPPELPDVRGPLLARAARAVAAAGPRSTATTTAHVFKELTDAEVQQRLQAFTDMAKPVYRVPGEAGVGGEFAVAMPFRMVAPLTMPKSATPVDRLYVEQEWRVVGHSAELKVVAATLGIGEGELHAIEVGRGEPRRVAALTQALIDANKLPPVEADVSPVLRIRRMMADYGIGYDCAGYVQQAFLAAYGITRAEAGFIPILNESLSALWRPRFSRVAPEDSRPGDIIALGPPPKQTVGHRLMVLDRHDASPEEVGRYCTYGDAAKLAEGRISVITVESSFGSGADPGQGGVERQTWLYDAVSKRWGNVLPAQREIVGAQGQSVEFPERVNVASMPYDGFHPLLGIYHYSQKR
jgi:hypothetical protein